MGSGKVAEVIAALEALDVDTVIFDDELSPGQARNLEKVSYLGIFELRTRRCSSGHPR